MLTRVEPRAVRVALGMAPLLASVHQKEFETAPAEIGATKSNLIFPCLDSVAERVESNSASSSPAGPLLLIL